MSIDYSPLIATVAKVVDTLHKQKYISTLKVNDNQIVITYNNGFIQKFELPSKSRQLESTSLQEVDLKPIESKLDESLKSSLDKIDTKYKKELKTFVEDVRESKYKLETSLKAYIDNLIKQIPIPKDGNDGIGIDGKDAEEVDYDKIQSSIEALFYDYQTGSNKLINEAISNIVIPTPQDGRDGINGKDADEEKILAALKIELNDSLKALARQQEEALQVVVTQKEELKSYLEEAIQAMPIPKNGIDGQDADSEAIKQVILEDIRVFLRDNAQVTKEELKLFIALELEKRIANITIVGEKGEKGDSIKGDSGKDGESIKGDKGDKGNGIKDAQIDSSGHLIIKTDERKIDAGKVSVNNFFGSGGGEVSYTNSLPMPFKLGGLPKGTRFKNTNFKTLMTKLLYGVELPYFSAFTLKTQTGVLLEQNVEIGYDLQSQILQADYAIENDLLLAENSIVLMQDNQVLVENIIASPVEITVLEANYDEPKNIDFTILAYDTTGTSFQSTNSLSFKYRIYYGEEEEIINDGSSNPLELLRATELTTTIIGTEYHFPEVPNIVGAYPYKWFCVPKVFGEVGLDYIFCDLLTDIAILFADRVEITITNEYGLQIPYYCYRTENKIFGAFTMKVLSSK